MKKLIKTTFLALSLFILPVSIFAQWSNTSTVHYYRNGYSWGWDYGVTSIARESSYIGSSAYGEITYFNKTSWTNPSATIVNLYRTYRTNTIAVPNASGSNVRLYNMRAPQGESTNILIKGNSLQQGADTINISFTPY